MSIYKVEYLQDRIGSNMRSLAATQLLNKALGRIHLLFINIRLRERYSKIERLTRKSVLFLIFSLIKIRVIPNFNLA